MIQKRFELIDKSDIDALIANAVSEGKTIDYKEILPGNSDGDKKEFLKDISSFANASGGDIIYGVQEKRDASGKATGMPNAAKGLAGVNVDQETLRLDNLIRNGIAPRISGVQIKGIDGFPSGPVIVIRVPRSWAAPHMITFQSESRFFSRTNAGKYPLDVTEIRSAFALSESLPEKVRRFRDERLARIVADEAPVLLGSSAKVVLHVYPIASADATFQINLRDVENEPSIWQLIYHPTSGRRYNFDGLVAYSSPTEKPGLSYLQVFRNGIIEAVDVHMLRDRDGRKTIPSVLFEENLISASQRFLALEQRLGVPPPFFIMLSLVDVSGYIMATRQPLWPDEVHPIDRNVLLLPDILVEDYNVDLAAELRTVFDVVWQSAGWGGSLNYDEQGNWGGRR